MTHVLNMLFSVVFIKSMKKGHSENFYHYKKIEDGLNFDDLNFPAKNYNIDKFEELKHNVSVNVFEVDDEQEQIVISRKLKKCWMPYWWVKDWWGWYESLCIYKML